MSQLFNKNGLPVKNNPKAIQDELVRGTGFVIAEKVSAFIQNASLHEKHVVISIDNGMDAPTEKKFIIGRIKEALELFQRGLSESKS
ncbi:MAG: hypothetical protein ACI9UO_002828 [Nitrospinales bacterium]|jgi:hypothetical protein